MKKEYVCPSVSVVKINYAGMLCVSGGEDEQKNFDTEDTTDEVGVHNTKWNGESL